MRNSQKTKKQVIFTIYSSQLDSSKKRGHPAPSYDKYWLYYWCMENPNFHALFDLWVNKDYDIKWKPSVDRILDDKPYTKENIQIMTFNSNRAKSHLSVLSGDLSRNTKYVHRYSLEEAYIDSFPSVAVASRLLNINRTSIGLVANGKRDTAGGYIFKFSKI